MKGLSVLGLFGVACCALAAMALGSPAAAATLEWGDAVAQVGDNVKPTVEAALTVVITGVLIKYAGPFGMLIRQQFVTELIEKAVNYGFAVTFGAQRGKTLSLDESHKVFGAVVRYAENHFPWVLRVMIGGATKLIEKAIARMPELPLEFQGAPQLPTSGSISQ